MHEVQIKIKKSLETFFYCVVKKFFNSKLTTVMGFKPTPAEPFSQPFINYNLSIPSIMRDTKLTTLTSQLRKPFVFAKNDKYVLYKLIL